MLLIRSENMARTQRIFFVPLFIVINVAVFLLWNLSPPSSTQFMMDNFTVSWTSLVEHRYWDLITSVFSHNFLLHILINMFVLRSFGTLLESVLGSWRFFWFYMIAGMVSSFSHAALSAFVLGQPDLPAVGASGALAGLVLVFSLLFPREKILIFGLIPVPAMFGALAFIALDIWGLVAQAEGGGLPIGHGAHLGGAFTGIVYYVFFLRPRLKRRPEIA